MTYFISDIHGEYQLFCQLMNQIAFSKSDRLIVLGDIIDKGPESIRLARLISQHSNMAAIMGNHEHNFIKWARHELTNEKFNSCKQALSLVDSYFPPEQSKFDLKLLRYIFSLPYFIEEDKFICVHAGLELDANNNILPLKQQAKETLVFNRKFKEVGTIVNCDKAVLFGHTPCSYSNGTGQFIKQKRDNSNAFCDGINRYMKICLDTGVEYTHVLGCLRLEDMQEFYTKK